ncbi:MAG: hypothetical protein ACHP7N_09360, partial [Caulobacterales bacterium]
MITHAQRLRRIAEWARSLADFVGSGETMTQRFGPAVRGRRLGAWPARIAVALALALSAGAASAAAYVSAALSDVKPEDKAVVANPQPVQLIFQFQTKGAPNAQATKYVRQQVIDAVKSTGIFSDVGDAPTANGAVVSITIYDIADAKDMGDAEAKGAVTGAT